MIYYEEVHKWSEHRIIQANDVSNHLIDIALLQLKVEENKNANKEGNFLYKIKIRKARILRSKLLTELATKKILKTLRIGVHFRRLLDRLAPPNFKFNKNFIFSFFFHFSAGCNRIAALCSTLF